MKKFLIAIICLIAFGFLNVSAVELPEVTDHEKVTIYIFRGNGCGFCRNALVYFNENADKYSDYIEVKTYEVWENQYNSDLMLEVAEKMGDELTGVPYIVIGNTYSENGFLDTLGEDMIEAALQEYQSDSYVDLVAEVAEKHESAQEQSLYDSCVEEEIIVVERDTTYDTIIILGIFALIIGGGVALVLFSRKK
ncbi:MAG: thioredoxin family protein [Firmicutes bacterium]|nr:thioredoxin family protein [Bacillota bacterium]